MTNKFHLKIIDEQGSNLAEKYDIRDCQGVILATIDLYKKQWIPKALGWILGHRL